MDGQINRTRGKGDKLTCARREIYVGENGSIYKAERNGIYNFSLLKLPSFKKNSERRGHLCFERPIIIEIVLI